MSNEEGSIYTYTMDTGRISGAENMCYVDVTLGTTCDSRPGILPQQRGFINSANQKELITV